MAHPKIPWAVNSTGTLVNQQDAADESKTNRKSHETRHRPPSLQLNRTNSIPVSRGPLSTTGTNRNTDQTYRILPIIAGILMPLSVLLSIPSLTSSWHVRTDGNPSPSNPLYHIVGMSLSVACGVLANISIVLRFAERSIKRMTFLCIFLLSMNGSCLSCAFIFLLTDINHSTNKYNRGHCLRSVSSKYRGIRLRTIILDVCLLNGDFSSDQHFADHRLLSYKRFYKVRYVVRYLLFSRVFFQLKSISTTGSGLTHKQRSLIIIIKIGRASCRERV